MEKTGLYIAAVPTLEDELNMLEGGWVMEIADLGGPRVLQRRCLVMMTIDGCLIRSKMR